MKPSITSQNPDPITSKDVAKHTMDRIRRFSSDDDESHRFTQQATSTFIAGAAAGVISRSVLLPFSVIKAESASQGKGIRAAVRRVAATGGLSGFWKANVPALLRIAPNSGMKFLVFHQMLSVFREDLSVPTYHSLFFAGAAAGSLSSVITHPLDVLKVHVTQIRLNREPLKLRSLTAIENIYAAAGLRGFTRGAVVSSVGAGLHSGLVFMSYYSLRSWFLPPGESRILPTMVAGGVAGAFAQLTYPLDYVKKNCMARNMHAYDFVWLTYSRGGLLGFYQGAFANLAKAAPFFATSFAVYELVLRGLV